MRLFAHILSLIYFAEVKYTGSRVVIEYLFDNVQIRTDKTTVGVVTNIDDPCAKKYLSKIHLNLQNFSKSDLMLEKTFFSKFCLKNVENP